MHIIAYYWLIFLLQLPGFGTKNSILKKDIVIDNDRISFSISDLKISVSSEGNIFVMNSSLNEIYLFSKEGEVKGGVSREGRGPGEFIGLADISLDGQDNLYALDPILGKVTIFSSPDYEPSSEVSIPSVINHRSAEHLLVLQNGNYLITYSKIISLKNTEQGENVLYSFDHQGAIIQNNIFSYKDDQIFVYTRGDQIATVKVPFGYQSILRLGPSGNLYLGETDLNYIQVYDKGNKLEHKIEIPYKPVNVPSKKMQEFRKMALSDELASSFFKKLLDADVIPDVMPVFDWFVVDSKNRIWVAVNISDDKNYSLIIVDTQGNKIAETVLPKEVKLQTIRDGYAYGIQKDKDGRQTIIRYKIKNIE